MRGGIEITPEAPILRIELLRDNLELPEKGFSSSEREAKTEPEAPARDHRGAWETFSERYEMEEEEIAEKRENENESVALSKQGTKVWERPRWMKCGTEINPEAPKPKSRFYQRDLLFNKKQDKYQEVIFNYARDDPESKNSCRNKTKKQREKWINQNNIRNVILIVLIDVSLLLRKKSIPYE